MVQLTMELLIKILCVFLLKTHVVCDVDLNCFIRNKEEFIYKEKDSLSARIWALITTNEEFQVKLFSSSEESSLPIDILSVNPYRAEHTLVRREKNRERKRTRTHLYNTNIKKEGWNNISLFASSRKFKMSQIRGADFNDLLDLTFDYDISMMSFKGMFSICSGVMPEWKLDNKQDIFISLYPLANKQILTVTKVLTSHEQIFAYDEGNITIMNSNNPVTFTFRKSTTIIIDKIQRGLINYLNFTTDDYFFQEVQPFKAGVIIRNNLGSLDPIVASLEPFKYEEEEEEEEVECVDLELEYFIKSTICHVVAAIVHLSLIVIIVVLGYLLNKEVKLRNPDHENCKKCKMWCNMLCKSTEDEKEDEYITLKFRSEPKCEDVENQNETNVDDEIQQSSSNSCKNDIDENVVRNIKLNVNISHSVIQC
ncbi:hypothetical protein CsNV_022 [Callinectes sapidus nudivirus]|nr:hypothetical protein CsNV_022 [Callinectes sapidus nudivirus]